MSKRGFDIDIDDTRSFKAPLTQKELTHNVERLRDGVSEKEGIDLIKRSPRLFAVAVSVLENAEKIMKGRDTLEKVVPGGTPQEVSRFITVLSIAQAADMIDKYARGEFIVE